MSKFSEYAKIVNVDTISELKIDLLINCSMHYHLIKSLDNIKREKTILWVHHLINLESCVLSFDPENKKIDCIISVSETITNKLKILFPSLAYKIHTIYNVVSKEEIIESSKESINLDLSDTLNLVTVSRVCKAKGFDRMLYLAKLLKDFGINFKWFIIGDNYFKSEFEEIFESYRAYKSNFEWLGFLETPHKIVNQCDYSVLLSDDETWGLVLTEAMILGVPCIATDFEVAYEQIEDRINGIILSREDLNSYKTRILDIVINKKRCKDSVSDFNYNNEEIIESWISLLDGTYIYL